MMWMSWDGKVVDVCWRCFWNFLLCVCLCRWVSFWSFNVARGTSILKFCVCMCGDFVWVVMMMLMSLCVLCCLVMSDVMVSVGGLWCCMLVLLFVALNSFGRRATTNVMIFEMMMWCWCLVCVCGCGGEVNVVMWWCVGCVLCLMWVKMGCEVWRRIVTWYFLTSRVRTRALDWWILLVDLVEMMMMVIIY